MNRALSLPLRVVGTALRKTGAAFTLMGMKAVKNLTLIPGYLADLLWLLSSAFLELAKQGYGGNSACYAVLRVLSTSVAEPPLLAYTMTPAGEPDTALDFNHPLMRLIRQPNELMSEVNFWELSVLQAGITGRTFWWKERDRLGNVIALWPLRPDRVGPIYSDATEEGQKVIHGWSYLIPGTSHYQPIARDDVFFWSLPDPGGDSGGVVDGLGPLQVLAAEVGADNEATRFVGAILSNYGTPGVALQTATPIADQATATKVKDAFMREFGGARRGLPIVIDAGTTIQQMSFNLQQLEFPALRKHSESRIAAAFGVPAVLAGLQVGLETSTTNATITEQREYFTETTCAHYWRKIETAFTNQVASEFGPDIVCRFDLTKVKALMEQNRSVALQVENAFDRGCVTIDEYRAAVLNYEPLPNGAGNARVLSKGAQEVDEDGQPVIAPTPPPQMAAPQAQQGDDSMGTQQPPAKNGNGNGAGVSKTNGKRSVEDGYMVIRADGEKAPARIPLSSRAPDESAANVTAAYKQWYDQHSRKGVPV